MRRLVVSAGLAIVATLGCGAAGAQASTAAALAGAAQDGNATTVYTSGTMSVASAPGLGRWYAFTPSVALAPLVPAAGPTNTTAPSISGSATVGSTLTADQGVWSGDGSAQTFDYQWQSCDPSSSCTDVGTDSNQYTVAQSDIGNTLVVAVTATDDTGTSGAVTSNPTAVVPGAPSNNSSAVDLWERDGRTRCSLPITAAGPTTRAPTTISGRAVIRRRVARMWGPTVRRTRSPQADIGNTLVVTVTATNSAGTSSPVTSNPTAVVPGPPANSVLPSISGTATVGHTLTADPGSWSGNPSYSYQWQSCNPSSSCTNVGTNSNQYTVASSDAGNTLEVVVTASNTAGSTSATSNPTAVVIGAPANTVLPSISGTAAVGSTLTASSGSWSGNPSYSYQWQSCNPSSSCTNVGTNSNQYTVASSDAGNTLEVVVTASNTAGSTAATSNPTSVVVGVPANTVLPSISGTAAVGSTLTASTGTWSGGPTYSYQWQSCNPSATCTNVGTNSAQYLVASSDAGNTLRVQVTASNIAGSASATSAASSVVVANTALPVVTGSTAVGGTLSASTGTWTGSPTYTYQWQHCNAQGTSCTAVTNATASTYPVALKDVGTTLRVVVTAHFTGGTLTATSAATLVVTSTPGPPIAGFTQSILTAVPATGSPLTFTSDSTAFYGEGITSYAWSFGDGGSGTGASVAHTYAVPGTYTVTLTVTQTDLQTAQTSATVTVDAPPISGFTWSPSSPSVGTSLSFVNTASAGTGAGLASYSWSFGDGATSTSPNPTHTYATAGTYIVTLTVTQSDQLSATAQQSITVSGQTAGSNGTGSIGPSGSQGTVNRAAATRWLAGALASSASLKIGGLLKKNGVSSMLRAATASGHITITWYAVVRHHRIVIARGTAALRAHAKARLAIKLTAAGHALLAKSRVLTITVSGSFRSGPSTSRA